METTASSLSFMPPGVLVAWRRELLIARSKITPKQLKDPCYRFVATWSHEDMVPSPVVRGSSECVTACVQPGTDGNVSVFMTYFRFTSRRRIPSLRDLLPIGAYIEPIRTSQEGQRVLSHLMYMLERESCVRTVDGVPMLRTEVHPAELQTWSATWLDTYLNPYCFTEGCPSLFSLLTSNLEKAELLRQLDYDHSSEEEYHLPSPQSKRRKGPAQQLQQVTGHPDIDIQKKNPTISVQSCTKTIIKAKIGPSPASVPAPAQPGRGAGLWPRQAAKSNK